MIYRKFWKRWEYRTTWPALWEICTQVKKQQLINWTGTTGWFQIGKGVPQSCILLPCLFNLYAEYIMWNARLDEAQAGIKFAGRNINNLRYADDTTLMLPWVYMCSPSWTSLPIPSLWVIPVHQPQASCILHRTWTGDSFLIWYYTCFNAILPNHIFSYSEDGAFYG